MVMVMMTVDRRGLAVVVLFFDTTGRMPPVITTFQWEGGFIPNGTSSGWMGPLISFAVCFYSTLRTHGRARMAHGHITLHLHSYIFQG